MDTIALKAQKRDTGLTAHNLRKTKMVPAEFYGHGIKNLSIQLSYGDIRRAYKQAGGNTIIDLSVDGSTDTHKALIHQVDYHPVTDEITHVEFINVRMDEAIHTRVKVKLEGIAPAVKDLQGTLVQSIHEIEIKCLPADLIHEVTLNVESIVDFTVSLHVSDVKFPEKITVLTDANLTVATVVAPREEEAAAPAEPVDLSKIEVTTEKKVEEGAEAAAPEKAQKKEKKD